MATGEETPVSFPLEETSAVASDDNTLNSSISPASLPAVQSAVQPLVSPPNVPPIAPIPPIPPPIPRPLAPLPTHPPIIRPPVLQNGELRGNDSDSDNDGAEHPGSAPEYEISEESRQVRERQEKAMQDLLMKQRASALAVPTNDMAVRARLRRLGEPITLFGEREMERRNRLRMIMAKLDSEGQLEKLMKAHEEEEVVASAAREDMEEELLQYPFYTEGPKQLFDARVDITKYSIARAALRLHRARRKRDDPDEDLDAEIDWALKQAGRLVLDSSEIGDDRPLSGCSFSHDGKFLATW